MLEDDLIDSIDGLLSITSNSNDHARALIGFETILASLVIVDTTTTTSIVNEKKGHAFKGRKARLDAFKLVQDRFEYNICCVLLNWLGQSIHSLTFVTAASRLDTELIRSNLIRCLGLLQGFLLLHRPSQRLFTRRSSIQCLLAVLDLSRPSHVSSPLLSQYPPSPSPIHLQNPTTTPRTPTTTSHVSTPRTPKPSSSSSSTTHSESTTTTPAKLSLAALETLLCALVDQPNNMRTFEQVAGLNTIVKVLKDRSVDQSVRIKVIELLYYFLLPETDPTPTKAGTSLDFSQQPSERKTTTTTQNSRSLFSTNDENLRPISIHLNQNNTNINLKNSQPSQKKLSKRSTTPPPPPPSPPPSVIIVDSSNSKNVSYVHPFAMGDQDHRLAFASEGFVPQTPIKAVKSYRIPNSTLEKKGKGDDCSSDDDEEEEEEGSEGENEHTPKTNHRTVKKLKPIASNSSIPPSNNNHNDRLLDSFGNDGRMMKKTKIRTTREKKEMLRIVMPNVDALEERFKAMGLDF